MRIYFKGFVLVALVAYAMSAPAQVLDSISVGYSPRTGDVTVDAQLGDINVYARGDLDGFVDEVVVSYGAPRYLVRELTYERHWLPADVYYACALAHELGRPCRDVVDIYQRDRAQGWGAIALRLGIKPGSPAFHALKGKVGKSHDTIKAHGRSGAMPGKGHDKGHGEDKGKGNGKGNGKEKGHGGH